MMSFTSPVSRLCLVLADADHHHIAGVFDGECEGERALLLWLKLKLPCEDIQVALLRRARRDILKLDLDRLVPRYRQLVDHCDASGCRQQVCQRDRIGELGATRVTDESLINCTPA